MKFNPVPVNHVVSPLRKVYKATGLNLKSQAEIIPDVEDQPHKYMNYSTEAWQTQPSVGSLARDAKQIAKSREITKDGGTSKSYYYQKSTAPTYMTTDVRWSDVYSNEEILEAKNQQFAGTTEISLILSKHQSIWKNNSNHYLPLLFTVLIFGRWGNIPF